MKTNINGYCPNCNANFDGDLIIDYPLSLGMSREEAIKYASCYEGWREYKDLNRWSRKILVSKEGGRPYTYRCPDCKKDLWR